MIVVGHASLSMARKAGFILRYGWKNKAARLLLQPGPAQLKTGKGNCMTDSTLSAVGDNSGPVEVENSGANRLPVETTEEQRPNILFFLVDPFL